MDFLRPDHMVRRSFGVNYLPCAGDIPPRVRLYLAIFQLRMVRKAVTNWLLGC